MPKQILVIDDDEGILDGFQAMLEAEGYEVITCPNGEYLPSFSSKRYPDLILLDVLLSGQDGRKLCKQLKSQPDTKSIPVIIMSAALNIEESAREALANDFLGKPFDMDEVLQMITKYI